jgi:hypothetical protein
MAQVYRDEFKVDLLGPCYTSAGSVVSADLEAVTNAAGVVGFVDVKNTTVGKLLLNARCGGVVESRVATATKVWERPDVKDVESVFCLDLNR